MTKFFTPGAAPADNVKLAHALFSVKNVQRSPWLSALARPGPNCCHCLIDNSLFQHKKQTRADRPPRPAEEEVKFPVGKESIARERCLRPTLWRQKAALCR